MLLFPLIDILKKYAARRKDKKGADNKYVLAIDHGTSGVKTAIVSVHGEIVDSESEKTPVYFLPNGGAEQDPDDWWNALVKTSTTD